MVESPAELLPLSVRSADVLALQAWYIAQRPQDTHQSLSIYAKYPTGIAITHDLLKIIAWHAAIGSRSSSISSTGTVSPPTTHYSPQMLLHCLQIHLFTNLNLLGWTICAALRSVRLTQDASARKDTYPFAPLPSFLGFNGDAEGIRARCVLGFYQYLCQWLYGDGTDDVLDKLWLQTTLARPFPKGRFSGKGSYQLVVLVERYKTESLPERHSDGILSGGSIVGVCNVVSNLRTERDFRKLRRNIQSIPTTSSQHQDQ